jgi:hypothetical protein
MLAPLHWHDYKKKYGKLDEFVVGHPEVSLLEFQHAHVHTCLFSFSLYGYII